MVKLSLHVNLTLSSGSFLSIASLSIPSFLSIAASMLRSLDRKPPSCLMGVELYSLMLPSEVLGLFSMSMVVAASFSSVVKGRWGRDIGGEESTCGSPWEAIATLCPRRTDSRLNGTAHQQPKSIVWKCRVSSTRHKTWETQPYLYLPCARQGYIVSGSWLSRKPQAYLFLHDLDQADPS